MERAHLIGLKRTNDSVQHATIMEQDVVLFLPVVRVHQQYQVNREMKGGGGLHAHLGRWQDAASYIADRALP